MLTIPVIQEVPIMENVYFALELTATGLLVVFTALVAVALIVRAFQMLDQPDKGAGKMVPATASAGAATGESSWQNFLRYYVFIPSPGDSGTKLADSSAAAPAGGSLGVARTGTGMTDDIPPEVAAVIAASVAVAIGKQARITRIRYREAPANPSWHNQGRIAVMGSHNPKQWR